MELKFRDYKKQEHSSVAAKKKKKIYSPKQKSSMVIVIFFSHCFHVQIIDLLVLFEFWIEKSTKEEIIQ